MGCGRDFWTIICILVGLIGSTYLAVHNFFAAEFAVLLLLVVLGFFSVVRSNLCTRKLFFIVVILNTLYFLGLGVFSSLKATVFFLVVIVGFLLAITAKEKRCKPSYGYKVQAEPVKEVEPVKSVVVKKTTRKPVKKKAVKKRTTKRKTAKKATRKKRVTKKKPAKRKVTKKRVTKRKTTKRKKTTRRRK